MANSYNDNLKTNNADLASILLQVKQVSEEGKIKKAEEASF